jgi:hypothetical protein
MTEFSATRLRTEWITATGRPYACRHYTCKQERGAVPPMRFTVTLLPLPGVDKRHCLASVLARLMDTRDYPPFVGHTGDVPIRLTNVGQPAPSAPRGARDTTTAAAESHADNTAATPNWFADFLMDRATRKPSAHTLKAYRQDLTAVADLLSAGRPPDIALTDIRKTACGQPSPPTRPPTNPPRSGGAGRRGMCCATPSTPPN